MTKLLPALTAAVILLLLTMAAVDFLTTGHFDPVSLSCAVCGPLLCATFYRLACRPARQLNGKQQTKSGKRT